MSDDLATAYALRSRAEARPDLIRSLATGYMAEGTKWIDYPQDRAQKIANFADALLAHMFPTETKR